MPAVKFFKTYSVRASEISPTYLLKDFFVGMYFQDCFAEYMASKNLAAYDLSRLGLTWLTSDVIVEFGGKMPFWRENVDIAVWFWKLGSARAYVDFEAFSGGQRIARGSSIQLIASIGAHKPVRLEPYLSSIETEKCGAFESCQFTKICERGEFAGETSQVVRFDDLDFNMHLNNVKYIPRALEAIPLNYRNSHSLKSYRLKYMRETFFGNTVKSVAMADEDSFFHRLVRCEDGLELCRAETFWTSPHSD